MSDNPLLSKAPPVFLIEQGLDLKKNPHLKLFTPSPFSCMKEILNQSLSTPCFYVVRQTNTMPELLFFSSTSSKSLSSKDLSSRDLKEKKIFTDFRQDPSLSLRLDFLERHLEGKRQNESLEKVFRKNKKPLQILDATCGFATDSFTLSLMGHKVLGLEQNPFVYAFVKQSLLSFENHIEAKKTPLEITPIELVHQEACDFLQKDAQTFHTVYLDPMFSLAKKALPQKKMQILTLLSKHKPKQDETKLLKLALERAESQVIVKRHPRSFWLGWTQKPLKKAFLEEKSTLLPKPSYCIKSKLLRYDIYRKGVR